MLEKTLEMKLKNGVRNVGGIALKFWCISFTGFPDRMVLLPGGRVHFIEMKAPGKTPGPLQRVVHAMLLKLGFRVFILNSLETVKEYLANSIYDL